MSQLILARSGKAATDTERKYLEDVMGATDGMGERQLVESLKRIGQIARDTEADLGTAYPGAAADFAANRPGATPELVTDKGGAGAPPPASGTVRLYRNGEEYNIPAADVEEALQAGFKRGR